MCVCFRLCVCLMPVCVYCVCVCVVSALCLCVCAKVLLFCIEFICLFCQPLDLFATPRTPPCLNPLPGCGNYVTIKLPVFDFSLKSLLNSQWRRAVLSRQRGVCARFPFAPCLIDSPATPLLLSSFLCLLLPTSCYPLSQSSLPFLSSSKTSH